MGNWYHFCARRAAPRPDPGGAAPSGLGRGCVSVVSTGPRPCCAHESGLGLPGALPAGWSKRTRREGRKSPRPAIHSTPLRRLGLSWRCRVCFPVVPPPRAFRKRQPPLTQTSPACRSRKWSRPFGTEHRQASLAGARFAAMRLQSYSVLCGAVDITRAAAGRRSLRRRCASVPYSKHLKVLGQTEPSAEVREPHQR
jgi:hypothetical protein